VPSPRKGRTNGGPCGARKGKDGRASNLFKTQKKGATQRGEKEIGILRGRGEKVSKPGARENGTKIKGEQKTE